MLDHAAGSGRAPLIDHPGDRYDTPPVAVEALLRCERLPELIWEPACGTGNIVEALRAAGHKVIATDLNDRGCSHSRSGIDFLLLGGPPEIKAEAIITNPPYQLAEKFVETALLRAPLVIMLLRLAFFEGQRRSRILEGCGLARIHVFRKRLPMMHREGWTGKRASSAIAFAWYCWDRNHRGPVTIDRISWEKPCQ
jgi:hypothetical protein